MRHAIDWRHGYHAAVADRVEPWEHGTVVRTTDLPTFYEYNLARVEGPDPGLSAEQLAEAAEPHLEGLTHRRIEVEDADAGARLRSGFEAHGLGLRAARLHGARAARRGAERLRTARSCASGRSRPAGRCGWPGRASRPSTTRPSSC